MLRKCVWLKRVKKYNLGLNAQITKELDRAIDDLTLFDDDLMSKVFDGNTEATELLIRIILERNDIKVLRVKGQVDMKSPYPSGRSIRIVRETGKPYDDGAYIIYVNGLYKGKNAFGKLAHDFNCKNADEIYYEPLAEGVRHFKETEKGREAMCESFSRLANKVGDQRVEQAKVDMVKELMNNMKLNLEQALTALGIKGKERAIIAKQLQPK